MARKNGLMFPMPLSSNEHLKNYLEENILGSSQDRILQGLLRLSACFGIISSIQGITEMNPSEIIDHLRSRCGESQKTTTPPNLNEGIGGIAVALLKILDIFKDPDEPSHPNYHPPHTERIILAILFFLEFIWDFSHAILILIRDLDGGSTKPAEGEKPVQACFEAINSVRRCVTELFEDLRETKTSERLTEVKAAIDELLENFLEGPVKTFAEAEPHVDEEKYPHLYAMMFNLRRRAFLLAFEFHRYHFRRRKALAPSATVRRQNGNRYRRFSRLQRIFDRAPFDKKPNDEIGMEHLLTSIYK